MRLAKMILICGTAFLSGCVQRTLSIQTDPPGALVWLNGREIGRTPLERSFTWYGKYELEIRRQGRQTLKSTLPVKAPWWQWVPFDLFAELLPLHDRQNFHFDLPPASTGPTDPAAMLRRAAELREQLPSSQP